MEIIVGLAVVAGVAYLGWRFLTGGASLRTTLLQSQSAVVVQNLLEMHGRIVEPIHDPQGLAHNLVARVGAQRPDVVSGGQGLRPHKLSLASIALANGLDLSEFDDDTKSVLFLSLGTILLELTGKPHQYALSAIDHRLIGASQAQYIAFDQSRESLQIAI